MKKLESFYLSRFNKLKMKKSFKISGMHCNSCAMLIEKELKDKVNLISVDYAGEKAEVDFNESKISEKEIKNIINQLGYDCEECCDADGEKQTKKNKIGWFVLILASILLLVVLYFFIKPSLPEISIPNVGDKAGLLLLFAAGLLTGFHCIAMCGGFVVSYTAKNALQGHKSFKQHLYYGAGKLVSYTIIGGIFGLIGGFIAFSIGLRGWIAIIAGLYMIVYSLGMFGIGFFKRFQPSFKFLSGLNNKISGGNSLPLVTGLLNGLFLACGPLQAMYIYAAGTGSIISGASSLFAFGLGTLPVMLGFGFLATSISHKTTGKILKISAIIVLILGLVMLNRGLTLTDSSLSFDKIQQKFAGSSGASAVINNGIQIIKMDVDASGYNPGSFVLKKGVKVRWEINVKQLTGCNSELIAKEYGIDLKLKQGAQNVEFTPDKTGNFGFSCGMGMLRGSFIVTESGQATQNQIAAASPKSSGSTCSMGANGGGCGCGM